MAKTEKGHENGVNVRIVLCVKIATITLYNENRKLLIVCINAVLKQIGEFTIYYSVAIFQS